MSSCPVRDPALTLRRGVRLLSRTTGPEAHFCGYYDHTPWSPSGRRFLFLAAPPLPRLPRAGEAAWLCVEEDGRMGRVASTRAWNWQVGARQLWLDDEHVLFNDCREGRFVTVRLHVGTGREEVRPAPFWSVDRRGRRAVTVDPARLHLHDPSYGFAGAAPPRAGTPVPDDDGLYLVDLATGGRDLVVSLRRAAAAAALRPPAGTPVFAAHPTINPAGDRCVFFLRFVTPDDFLYSVLLAVDLPGGTLRVLGREMVSHFAWWDDRRLLVWMRDLPALARLRAAQGSPRGRWLRPVLRSARRLKRLLCGSAAFTGRFRLVHVDTGERRTVARRAIRQDGHVTPSPDGRWLLGDTYPDRRWRRHLYLYDLRRERPLPLASLASPPDFGLGAVRCDLHPRWHPTGGAVAVDSTHEGTRQVYRFDLRELLEREA